MGMLKAGGPRFLNQQKEEQSNRGSGRSQDDKEAGLPLKYDIIFNTKDLVLGQ